MGRGARSKLAPMGERQIHSLARCAETAGRLLFPFVIRSMGRIGRDRDPLLLLGGETAVDLVDVLF